MTPAGLEPAIPGSVGRCLIHWATGPVEPDSAGALRGKIDKLGDQEPMGETQGAGALSSLVLRPPRAWKLRRAQHLPTIFWQT